LTPGAKSKVKSSAQRAIRAKAIETYPRLEPYMDEIMPKKEQIDLVKVYVSLIKTWLQTSTITHPSYLSTY
jgi:hypothetical protein